jgi:hypothetical protein
VACRNSDEEVRAGGERERLEGNHRRFCEGDYPVHISGEVVQAEFSISQISRSSKGAP